MNREIFDTQNIAPEVLEQMVADQAPMINEVKNAIANNAYVVVGMKGNPHCKNAVKALKQANIDFCYLEYGSYFAEWRKRLSLKIWVGWKTFPMVFVEGKFIGGCAELKKHLR